MSSRRSFRLRTLLLLVAAAGLCSALGRSYFIPKCCHVVGLARTFRGPFEHLIVADTVIKSCATGAQDDGQYYVEFQLEEMEGWEREIPLVRRGLSARIKDLDSGAKVGDGQVTAIGPKRLEQGWGKPVILFPVRVDITALKSRIREGQKVEVCIPVLKQKDALQVPVNAVFEVGRDDFVIVRKGRHLETRRIRVKAHNRTKDDKAINCVIDESRSDLLPVGAWVIANPPPRPWLDALRRHIQATAKNGTRVQTSLTQNCPVCRRALSDHCRLPFDR